MKYWCETLAYCVCVSHCVLKSNILNHLLHSVPHNLEPTYWHATTTSCVTTNWFAGSSPSDATAWYDGAFHAQWDNFLVSVLHWLYCTINIFATRTLFPSCIKFTSAFSVTDVQHCVLRLWDCGVELYSYGDNIKKNFCVYASSIFPMIFVFSVNFHGHIVHLQSIVPFRNKRFQIYLSAYSHKLLSS
jgi:hypothetical protein